MDYYLNEYSLRGQFKDTDDFFRTLREKTLPVLEKLQDDKENIIWKKDTFWQCKICDKISLSDIPRIQKQGNERSPEFAALKMKLIRLVQEEPFWGADEEIQTEVKEYGFDKGYRDHFEEVNCFYKAVRSEGRVVSFLHEEYTAEKLLLIVTHHGMDAEIFIDNIYALSWWNREPEIITWRVDQKYLIEIRANEFSYHPPHFHVTYNEYSAVFKLSDGTLYRDGKNKGTPGMMRTVCEWYDKYKEELAMAWKNLHG